MTDTSHAHEERFNELADEFAARQRAGDRPRLEDYCARHPDLADDIRSLFPALIELERAKVDAGFEPAVRVAEAPSVLQLGDFRLLREVGRGGMGVVYEAEQVSLGRRVAIKLLAASVFREPGKRRRFEREAKAAARLHHTNIVPVHGYGEHEGTPYYVMQFIPGLGLDAVIDELAQLPAGSHTAELAGPPTGEPMSLSVSLARSLLVGDSPEVRAGGNRSADAPTLTSAGGVTPDPAPLSRPDRGSAAALSTSGVHLPGQSGSAAGSPPRKKTTYWESVARIGVQVGGALAYAHKLGVLHRDIKPANLLLDLEGIVWVTDFGLAKADDSDNLTRTGDVLGTLRYMPPEAFEGRSDARSDVYALGLTLFELAALRPAYDEQDRNKLVKQVTTGDPSRLRKLRRDAPRDLVTIVEKAIDRDPSRRYQTAEQLASDLQRFIDDKPILARQQTYLEQSVRWVRHNPGIAALGGLLAAVLVLVTVASLLAAGHFNQSSLNEAQAAQNERDARHEAELSRRAESWQRQRAEESAAAALASLKEADEQRDNARQQRELTQQNLYYAQMHLAQQAWREHRGMGHMRRLLTHWLPTADSPDRRGWEWFYLNSLPHQNVRTLTESGRGGRPSTVAWHIASNRIAEGTSTGLIRIWDADRERVALTLSGPAPVGAFWGIRWLVWSPDGSKLAAGCHDGSVHVWDTGSGRVHHVYHEHKSPVMTVAYSSDGTRLAAWGGGGRITIHDAISGRLIRQVAHPGGVTSGAWSPDDNRLACGHQDGTVTISDTNPGGRMVTLRGHADAVYHLAWNPDGARLASTGGDFTAKVWDVASEKMILGPLRHSHGVSSAAWEPDGQRLATGSFDETIKIWDATRGREVLTLRGHMQTVTSLAWGPRGCLASGCNDGSTKVWNEVRDQESRVLPGHGVRTTSVCWSPDGKRLASGGDDGTVRVWDPVTREEVLTIKAHDASRVVPQFGLIRTLAWRSDGTQLASAGLDGAVKVWEVSSGREVFALPGDRGPVWSLAWSPDETRLAAGAQDGTIRVIEWLAPTPKLHIFKAHQGRARGLAWSAQGQQLASAGWDGLVKLWDPVRGTELASLRGHQGGVFRVAWSPDGKQLVSAGNDRLVIAWDPATGQKTATMSGHNDWVDAVAFSPDGSRLASAGIDDSVRIWDPRTGEEAFALRGNSGMFHDVSWHPDGAQLAAASSDGRIWIWDATPGFERDTTPRALPFVDRRLAAKPANNAESLRLAQLAFDHKKHADAVRLWTEAFASDSELGNDRLTEHRYNAARAALAAAGPGPGETPLDEAAKAKLREQALEWLKAELIAWREHLESGPPRDREAVVLILTEWKQDADLATIRDPAALAKLGDGEHAAFTRLWTDVTALLKTANAKHAAFLHGMLPQARKSHPNDSPELAYLLAQIGRAFLESEEWDAAEPLLRECLAIRAKVAPDSWTTFNTYSALGGSLLGQKRYAEAEPLLLKGYAGMKQRETTIPPVGMDRLPEAAERLVDFYTATNKPDELKEWRVERAKYRPGGRSAAASLAAEREEVTSPATDK